MHATTDSTTRPGAATGAVDTAPFRATLRGFRERRRWSQERLAEEAAPDHSLVSRLESGAGYFPSRPEAAVADEPAGARLYALLRDPGTPAATWARLRRAPRRRTEPRRAGGGGQGVGTSFVMVTDLFAGCGGSSRGAEDAGAEVVIAANHWELAVRSHAANFPATEHDCADISATDPRRYRRTTVLIASPECFPAGTLILAERGLVPIEEIADGDRVLTHRGRWRPVTARMTAVRPTVMVAGQGHPGLETTAEHPFYARRQDRRWDNTRRDYDRHVFGEPEWRPAGNLRDATYRWATPTQAEPLPVPPIPGRGMPLDEPEFWWLAGRWVGDGTVRLRPEAGGEITIVAGNHEADELEGRLARWQPAGAGRAGAGELRWRRRRIRTATLFECGHQALADWLVEHFGRLAHGKTIPAWALTLPQPCRAALLEGYLSADGHFSARATSCSTVSKRLAIGVRLLAESLGYRARLYHHRQHCDTIEGRKLRVRDQWTVRWENNASQRSAVAEGAHAWSLVKRIAGGRPAAPVYNLAVDGDESYVADGIVVHNCTNHSLAKGRGRALYAENLFGDRLIDPAEERSRATMWDVVRFAEQHRYEIVIVENVVDAGRWILFPAWVQAMRALGYAHRCVYFNSMFSHPTPQSRDRLYVVFWKRGNAAPDLDLRPPAPCLACGTVVGAIQTWKRTKATANGPWGRYGRRNQYVYTCPTCAGEVAPFYYPACHAIDWRLPVERIGDRREPLKPATIARIRRGLEKFAGQRLHLLVDRSYVGGNGAYVRSAECDPWFTQMKQQSAALVTPPADGAVGTC